MPHNLNEIQFDVFRCSLVERCVFRGSELVPLTGKEYAIFTVLLEAQGQVVQKNDLCKIVWPEKIVEDSNLFHHVRALRKKLGTRENGKQYIETIPGRGYRLLVESEEGPEAVRMHPVETSRLPPAVSTPIDLTPAIDLAAPVDLLKRTQVSLTQDKRNSFPRRLMGLAALVILAIVAAIFLYSRHRQQAVASSPVLGVITSPESGPGPRVVAVIPVGRQPVSVALNDRKNEAFVSELTDDSVGVIDTTTDKVVAQIPVGHEPFALVLSADKKRLFIAQQGGGVGVIDTLTHSFQSISGMKDPVHDIAITPDGKSAYLALGYLGLAKLDLTTESVKVISKIVYVRALAITPNGQRLYVSYQSKGPGGALGHDAIGYFNTADDRFAGAITGFANVGECLTASPDGSQIWENGADACDSPRYDHVGCPFVPGGLLNVLNTKSTSLAKVIGVRGARLQCITFSPDGEYAAVATTSHLMLIRSKDLVMTGSLPFGSSGKIAFTADGAKAYAPVNGRTEVAVIQLGAEVHTLRLTNREDTDQTVAVAILPSPDYDPQAIDPGSLVLDGVPVETSSHGSPAASIEYVTGYERHSLIVHFKIEPAKVDSQTILVGKTYSGTPVRGVVDPL